MTEGSRDRPTPLAYAQAESSRVNIRPYVLLPANIVSVVVPFIPLHGRSAISVFFAAMNRGFGFGTPGIWFWEGVISAPILLAAPLAIWTARLCRDPNSNGTERAIAWSLSGASLMMTLGAMGFTVISERPLTPLLIAPALVLMFAGISTWKLRSIRCTYAPALIAMTSAFAGNTLFLMLLVLSNGRLETDPFIGIAIAIWQLAAVLILLRRLRPLLPIM